MSEPHKHVQIGPITMGDTFTRGQIVAYLEEIPLGYRTEAEHAALEAFVTRAQFHFLRLDQHWQPSTD